jgi:hypothetical protein
MKTIQLLMLLAIGTAIELLVGCSTAHQNTVPATLVVKQKENAVKTILTQSEAKDVVIQEWYKTHSH